MRLILFHPGPARLSCDTCLKFVTDIERGEVETYNVTNRETGERERVPQPRPAGTVPPCERCPKGSPEQAKLVELSDKNWAALAHYRQKRAARFMTLTESEKRDPIIGKNFAIIDAAYQAFEMTQGARLQASEFAKLFRKE